MKNIQIVEFENLDVIADKAWQIIAPDLVDFDYLYHMDNHYDDSYTDRFKQIPELAEQMHRLGLWEHWDWTAVVVIYEEMPIHIDNKNLYPNDMGGDYSLNIPIRNTKDTYTIFYRPKPDQDPQRVYEPGTAIDFFEYEATQVEEIERVELLKPVLFNVSVPHNVVIESKQLPRVAIALRLNKKFQGRLP